MDPQINPRLQKSVLIAAIVLFAFFGFQVLQSLLVLRSTGALDVTTGTSSAIISISQSATSAAVVGKGSAKLRLEPGEYLVAVNDGGKLNQGVAIVAKSSSTSIKLIPDNSSSLPSVDAINFVGTDELLANGLTTDQITNFRELVFKLNKSAKNVIIDSGSVSSGYHNANDVDQSFSLNFGLLVESTKYQATLKYNDTINVELVLTDAVTNKVVYDQQSNN